MNKILINDPLKPIEQGAPGYVGNLWGIPIEVDETLKPGGMYFMDEWATDPNRDKVYKIWFNIYNRGRRRKMVSGITGIYQKIKNVVKGER